MSTKPWDKLRAPETKPPIRPGTWITNGGTAVEWKCDNTDVIIHTSYSRTIQMTKTSFREFADFCSELADQLGGE